MTIVMLYDFKYVFANNKVTLEAEKLLKGAMILKGECMTKSIGPFQINPTTVIRLSLKV
jgi:hypothetical protein